MSDLATTTPVRCCCGEYCEGCAHCSIYFDRGERDE